jgi:hypothetical protein
MKLFQVLIALAILSGCMISVSNALPKYASKEGKKCVYCHTAGSPPSAKNLNDTGKCYKANDHSLDKCKAPASN